MGGTFERRSIGPLSAFVLGQRGVEQDFHADVRDREPTITVLRKDAAVPDWSWSSPVSSDSPLEKRATPARAKLNILLDRIFGNHQDFRTEAAEIVDQALSDERAAILAEA